MNHGIKTTIFPVRDMARAKAFYGTLLGVEPYFDQPHYAAFRVGEQDVGLSPTAHDQGVTSPVGYWHVTDINQSLQSLLDAGAEAQQEIKDVGDGKLVATVKDVDGNIIGLIQPA